MPSSPSLQGCEHGRAVVNRFSYLLTARRQFDILQSGLDLARGPKCTSINGNDAISSRCWAALPLAPDVILATGTSTVGPLLRLTRHQFSRIFASLLGIEFGPPSFDPYIASGDPARLREPLQERPDPGLKFRIVRGCRQQHADPPHPLALLRARRQRPHVSGRSRSGRLRSG